MATGNLTQWAAGTGLDYVFAPSFVDAVYRNNYLLGMPHPVTGAPVFPRIGVGDSSYRWKVQSAGNSSAAVFTEGASAPTPVAQTYVNAAVSYTYFWAWIRISGHVRDAVRNASYEGLNLITNEFLGSTEDLRSLVNKSFLGSSYSGLEVVIDDSTTYAGISRGSAGYWEPNEDSASSGALTKTLLMDLIEVAQDNDKAGMNPSTSFFLFPRNQMTNYLNFSGTPNEQNTSFRANAGDLPNGFDISPRTNGATFQGIPIVYMPDMTDTVVLGLDCRQTKIGPNWGLSVRREFDIRGPQMSGDEDVYEVSCASTLICHDPKLNCKLASITA